jgi:hypothetical protein
LPRHAILMGYDLLRLSWRSRFQSKSPQPVFVGPGWQEILISDRSRWVA